MPTDAGRATKILVPSGALGLGYERAALARGVAAGPDLIAIDGGSTDSGPHYLGTGTSKYSRASTKAEWRELLAARAAARVPLVIGSAGTCGADAAVDWMLDITAEIAAESGQRLTVATLKSGQDAAKLTQALAAGRITALDGAPVISAEVIASCTNIVALAGAEAIQAALATGADVVIAGRATDAALIAALPLARGAHAGGAWHGAKVGECGALATTRPDTGAIQLEFDAGGFTVTPLGSGARATPHTVAAHMLYENADPERLLEPGGELDVTGARYLALDDARVRVTGSEWRAAADYTVKLEGARRGGYQVVSLALVRAPRYVARIHEWAADVEKQCKAKARARVGGGDLSRHPRSPLSGGGDTHPRHPRSLLSGGGGHGDDGHGGIGDGADFSLELRLIGADATLGELETAPAVAREVGVLGIVTARTEAAAMEVAKILNPYLLHHPLSADEPMPTFAFPFSPPELPRGAIYEFCLHHTLTLDAPMDAHRLEVTTVGK